MEKIDIKMLEFIRECCENNYSLGILFFLSKHPSTRFNTLAIKNAAGIGADIESALRNLIQKGLVFACTNNGVLLYALTDNAALRSKVLGLSTMSRYQLQIEMQKVVARNEVVPLPAVPVVSGI